MKSWERNPDPDHEPEPRFRLTPDEHLGLFLCVFALAFGILCAVVLR